MLPCCAAPSFFTIASATLFLKCPPNLYLDGTEGVTFDNKAHPVLHPCTAVLHCPVVLLAGAPLKRTVGSRQRMYLLGALLIVLLRVQSSALLGALHRALHRPGLHQLRALHACSSGKCWGCFQTSRLQPLRACLHTAYLQCGMVWWNMENGPSMAGYGACRPYRSYRPQQAYQANRAYMPAAAGVPGVSGVLARRTECTGDRHICALIRPVCAMGQEGEPQQRCRTPHGTMELQQSARGRERGGERWC